ncbi:Hypothetical protein DHA2_150163 [Giardia duodenalis]|uniref:Uncharacterized protein n=1 Tax=Giardia intestinalis TaxID=5741 RepID=V6TJM9_GIAIN|nr:Hypothetical protein DHA2_150163 [Giardia intestinalis]
MSTQDAWPPVYYDFRRYGLSFHKMKTPRIEHLVELCDHYLECLKRYEDTFSPTRTRAQVAVRQTINVIRGIALRLISVSKTASLQNNEKSQADYELEVLQAADLPTDPERTPESMKQQLLDLETAYVLRLDTVASLKRRIAMLEESLDPAISKHLF